MTRLDQILVALSSLLDRGLEWWVAQLKSLVPQRFATAFGSRRSSLVIDLGDNAVTFGLIKNAVFEEVGMFDVSPFAAEQANIRLPAQAARHKGPVIARLPSSQVFRDQVILPVAVRPTITNTIGLQLDRYSPLQKDLVSFDAVEFGEDRLRQTIDVDLAIVRKDIVERVEALLKQWKLTANQIGLENDDINVPALFDFRPKDVSDQVSKIRNNALLVCALFAVSWFALTTLETRRAQERDLWSAAIAAAKVEAKAATDLQTSVNEIKSQRLSLINQRLQPSPLDILEELSKVLPDDVWIEDFQLTDQTLTLRGQAKNGAALLSLIDASDQFRNVKFRSPVTTDPRTQKDRFDLALEIARPSP